MTPTERAFKHGVFKAKLYGGPGRTDSGSMYSNAEQRSAFRRGYESVCQPIPTHPNCRCWPLLPEPTA